MGGGGQGLWDLPKRPQKYVAGLENVRNFPSFPPKTQSFRLRRYQRYHDFSKNLLHFPHLIDALGDAWRIAQQGSAASEGGGMLAAEVQYLGFRV